MYPQNLKHVVVDGNFEVPNLRVVCDIHDDFETLTCNLFSKEEE